LYIKTVDKFVVADEELSMSLEGIENILLLAQFYAALDDRGRLGQLSGVGYPMQFY
jgi:hypothetical protein